MFSILKKDARSEISWKNVDFINEIWLSKHGDSVISPMKANRLLGILTTLLFIILKNCRSNRHDSSIKLMEVVFLFASSLVWVFKNILNSVLLFSQKSCSNLKILQKASSDAFSANISYLSNILNPNSLRIAWSYTEK